ncbi:MAG: DUF4870 domain-containing protein [Candidatus Omnitrophota bacterium]|nr:DUF4870 domain-containing protein [Candidatus Omnitrophota bacterium]
MAEQKDLGKSSTGMAPNLAAALSYLLGVITGIIFYVLEKENKFVRFHAMQSILFCGVWIVMNVLLMIVPIVGWMMAGIVNVIGTVLWLIVLFKAFSGEQFKIPVIGDLAEKNI